jgi:hypothetical protein
LRAAEAQRSPPLVFVEETIFAIKIQDTRPGGGWLSFGLAEVVKVIGEPALCSEWRCLNVRYIAAKDEIWDEFSRSVKGFLVRNSLILLRALVR